MKFVKMHGAGNDFLLVDARNLQRDWATLSVAMCERNFGAGADGLLLAENAPGGGLLMRTFNADGSEAEMCGNGVRCFAKFAVEEGLAKPDGDDFAIQTIAGPILLQLQRRGGEVIGANTDMGPPRFEPSEIPVAVEMPAPVLDLPVTVDGRSYAMSCVSMGNPHAVHFLDTAVDDFPLREVGPKVEHHALFPARVNFEIARLIDRGHIEARTWERGAGETLACGTGASAIMVTARLKGLVGDEVEIKEPGGVLTLRWNGAGNVFLSGPAAYVFSGDWPD